MGLMDEHLHRAWERHREWVKRRYGLNDTDVEELEALGVLPLPNGDVLIPPQVILGIERKLRLVQATVNEMRGGRSKKSDA